MKPSRRQFVSTAASSVAALSVASVTHARTQGKRKLSITFEGLAMIGVYKDPGAPAGLPSTSSRVDVLFLDRAEHPPTEVVDLAGGAPALLTGSVVVKVGGRELITTTGVSLNRSPGNPCNDEWANVANSPELERVVNRRVDIAPSYLGSSPNGLHSRITFRGGRLEGEQPISTYSDYQWHFNHSSTGYRQAFTDHLTWTAEFDDVGPVVLEATPFSGGPVTSFSIGSSPDVWLLMGSGRTGDPPSETKADHFVHYYELLEQSPELKLVPHRGDVNCPGRAPTKFTPRQETLTRQAAIMRQRFRKPVKDEDDCGTRSMLRGENGICFNAIAYTKVK